MGIQSNLRDHLLSQPPSFKKKKDYTLLETIGQGGFGKVVRAKWAGEGGGKEVALKCVLISYSSSLRSSLSSFSLHRGDALS